MADIDDDTDSAAMAEAMGFTGFGMQRSKKRKLTPPAQTGANNAPLGKRRPLNLPQPVVSGGGGGNAEEIDLDDDDDGDVEGVQEDGGEAEDEDVQAQAGLDALTFSDAAPTPATARPHHSLPPRPQQQQQNQHHHAGKGGRHPGARAGGRPGQAPWWEGEWDPRLVARMVENPWDRLEKQRGLGARGTWPATTRGARDGGDAAATPAGAGAGPAGTSGSGAAVGSLGVIEQQAAQATVS